MDEHLNGSTDWTKEKIIEFINREDLKYQRIELPYGLATEGLDRKSSCDVIFSGSLKGKSVLDVGSYLGYFCLEAAQRGASRAVGWEISEERVRQAQTLAEIKGLPVEYVRKDIEKTEVEEQFDVVLGLNILHHMANPISVLDRLIRLTREILILEMASLGHHDRAKLGISFLKSFFVSRTPSIIAGRGSTSSPFNEERKYFITQRALENMLKFQRHHFAKIEFIKSDFKNRYIVKAYKRRIKHLVIVAGPTASGKSTFIDNLKTDAYPNVNKTLGVGSFQQWDSIGANDLWKNEKTEMEGLIFHYDTLRPWGRSAKTHDRDEALHIVQGADRTSIITVYAEPGRLKQQIQAGEFVEKEPTTFKGKIRHLIRKALRIKICRTLFHIPFLGKRLKILSQIARKRHYRIREIYTDPQKTKAFYKWWFDFTLQLNPNDNIIASTKDDCAIYPVEEGMKKFSIE